MTFLFPLFSLFLHKLKSLMIASIPNIIGWLIISFARVSSCDLSVVCSHFWLVIKNLCEPLFYSLFLLFYLGLFIPVHGKVVGRIWCGNNLLHGKFEILFVCYSLDLCLKRIFNAVQSNLLFITL